MLYLDSATLGRWRFEAPGSSQPPEATQASVPVLPNAHRVDDRVELRGRSTDAKPAAAQAPSIELVARTELTPSGARMLRSMHIDASASPEEQLAQFNGYITYFSFPQRAAAASVYNRKVIQELGHTSVAASVDVTLRVCAVEPRVLLAASRRGRVSEVTERSDGSSVNALVSINLREADWLLDETLGNPNTSSAMAGFGEALASVLHAQFPHVVRPGTEYLHGSSRPATSVSEVERIRTPAVADPIEMQRRLVQACAGRVDGTFVESPGVLLLACTRGAEAADLSREAIDVTFCIAGISVETSLELVSHGGRIGRFTSSSTKARNQNLYRVEGSQRERSLQRLYLEQMVSQRAEFEEVYTPRESNEGTPTRQRLEWFNRTDAAAKATAMTLSMNLEQAHWLLTGRLAPHGNETEVQEVAFRIAEVLHGEYPTHIRSPEHYSGLSAHSRRYGGGDR